MNRSHVFLGVICCFHLVLVTDSLVALYETEQSEATNVYDCTYLLYPQVAINAREKLEFMKYCIRPQLSILIKRNHSFGCFNGGILRSFDVLKGNKVQIFQLMMWNVPLDDLDRYAVYLAGHGDE